MNAKISSSQECEFATGPFWFKNHGLVRTDVVGGGKVPTIAVVEDDELVRKVLEQHLTSAGFTVVAAPDTAAALRQLGNLSEIDLCLIDLVMPPGVPDGLEFARSLKSVRPDISVVLLTGYYAAALRIEEPWPILYKPIVLEELLSEINRTLSLNQPPIPTVASPVHTG